MNRSSPSRQAQAGAPGFTLVELLVALVIVGVLAAIAYPAYARYIVKGNRSAAQSYLLEMALAQAQFLADNRAYASTVAELATPTPAAIGANYTVTINVVSGPPPRYTITATPVTGARQANDGVLTIDGAGTKTPADKW